MITSLGYAVGDTVRVNKQNIGELPKMFENVDLKVLKIEGVPNSGDHGRRWVTVAIPDGKSDSYYGFRFEKVNTERPAGKEIEPEDIRPGDLISNTYVIGDLTLTRQGVVHTNKGDGILLTKSNQRIDATCADHFTLIKAAPEVDKVMEKLKESTEGTIVQLPNSKKTLCRKEIRNDGNKWVCFFPGGQDTMAEKTFASLVRDKFDELVWIA